MTKNIINKNFLSKVLDNSNQGIHIVDPTGTTLYYNKLAEEIDGISKEEILGKNMKDLVKTGLFSRSVALDVIDSFEQKDVVQHINDRVVIATGVPIMKGKDLEAVVVFIERTILAIIIGSIFMHILF